MVDMQCLWIDEGFVWIARAKCHLCEMCQKNLGVLNVNEESSAERKGGIE